MIHVERKSGSKTVAFPLRFSICPDCTVSSADSDDRVYDQSPPAYVLRITIEGC